MYKILIVEDEPINVAGLRAMIDPSVIELDFLPSASNGAEALNSIITYSPDILILDVELPEYQGMEFVEELQNLDVPCPLIIGMAKENNFAQVRDALRAGIFDFLVKSEITQLTLNKALIRAIEHMDQFKSTDHRPMPSLNNKLLTRLFYLRLLSSDDFPEEPEDVMRNLDIHFSYSYYCVAYFDLLKGAKRDKDDLESMQRYIISLLQKQMSNDYACQVMPWSADGYVIILADMKPINVPGSPLFERLASIVQMLNQKFGMIFSVGIGPDVTDPKSIRVSFLEGQNTYACTTEKQLVLSCNQIDRSRLFNTSAFIKLFLNALENEDIDEIDASLKLFADSLNSHHYHMNAVLVTCSDILHLSLTRVENLRNSILNEFPDLPCPTVTITGLKSVNDVLQWIQMLGRHLRQCFNENGKERKFIIVQAIKDYISEHCEERLSLQSVANIFHFSTSYVSRLFKQCGDIGFSDFVTKTKIEYSKNLLTKNDTPVIEIAARLGYDDPYYFSRVFKKHTGVSPREFLLQYHLLKQGERMH